MPDLRYEPGRIRQRQTRALCVAVALIGACVGGPALAVETLADQMAEYDAVAPKTIIQLQPFRQQTTATLPSGAPVRLISLSPQINSWFLLTLGADGASDTTNYHIENPDPQGQTLALVPGAVPQLALGGAGGDATCTPWDGDPSALATAQQSGQPYAPICDGRLYLRNQVTGAHSTLEGVTDFLRSNIWGGDAVVNFVKSTFYQDAYAEKDRTVAADAAAAPDLGPGAAPLDPSLGDRPVIGTQTDFDLTGVEGKRMALGLWYPVTGLDGVFATAIQPRAIDPAVFAGPRRTNGLDSVEASATDYLVAFDLNRYDLGFGLGTDHPRLNWSPRPPAAMQNAALPGPDGVGNARPLVRLGMVSPAESRRTIATFTAGFKREHGAFRGGPLAMVNSGSHYGFIEEGTIFSKLQPGLSTLYVLADGTINMKTWTTDDNALLPQIRFARQNGVPLIEPDPVTGQGVPGADVTHWRDGNWSGSAEADLRTLRAGVCLRDTGTSRYLIYGYFSTATPSAMARVYQAYGCNYAMILDMNALELTYLALYVRQSGDVKVEHVVPGMALSDSKVQGMRLPRFIAVPDNRDFFYMMHKAPAP
ncbi:MAG: hypothetical protein GC186_00070 [Rhodobacteraceae bacterium]|nr:hypothetical protein [Paracoccaceae bacterium]